MLKEINFTCCQVPECDLVAKELITEFSNILKSMDPLGRISALILTGSFARGEGSILKLDDQSYKVLGDIEFLAAIENRSVLESVRNSIVTAQEVFGEKLIKRRIACKVEVTPALPRFFRKLRPRIFDYELIQHGKTIWGDKTYLENIPRFKPQDILKIDPIYLLFNRIIEQLALLLAIKDGKATNGLESFYQMGKVYIDLATSILTFSGNYEDTYLKRAIRFKQLFTDKAFGDGMRVIGNIAERVSYWTDRKIRPKLENFVPRDMIDQNQLIVQWAQLAEMVKDVLGWEICNYLNLDRSTDLRKVLWSFSNSFALTQRIKEWIKFHINPKIPSNEKSIVRTMRLLRRGSPRTLIYFHSALLYFYIADQIAKGGAIDTWEENTFLGAYTPTGPGKNETTPLGLIDHLLRDWELYLRNN